MHTPWCIYSFCLSMGMWVGFTQCRVFVSGAVLHMLSWIIWWMYACFSLRYKPTDSSGRYCQSVSKCLYQAHPHRGVDDTQVPHLPLFLALTVFHLSHSSECAVTLICYSLMTDQIHHLFICLLVYWIPSFMNCQFKSFAHFFPYQIFIFYLLFCI